jgi:hypothetical protein
VLVCAASHADASSLRGSTDLANHTGVADFERMLGDGSSKNFPVPYYADGCLPDQFKDKCKPCMCLNGPIGGAYPTKRCDWNAVPDGSGSNGCVDKSPNNGAQCSENWMCISNYCDTHRSVCDDIGNY